MVKDAIRSNDPYRVFNDNRSVYNKTYDAICRVCGGQASMGNMKNHVNEHAIQLGLVEGEIEVPTTSRRKTGDPALLNPLYGDVAATFEQSLVDRDGEYGVNFDKELSSLLASVIVADATEEDVGVPPLCNGCSNY
jgi:hypothetical protein